jgi:hypothetical protein
MRFTGRSSLLAALVAAGICCSGGVAPLAHAQEAGGSLPVIVKVEEDWELEVGEPNTAANAPQVSMVMTPFSHTNSNHFLVLLNLHTHPDYLAGGIQVQQWVGGEIASYHTGSTTEQLSHTGETVRWTQRLELDSGAVRFSVVNGHGSTWGNFGGESSLQSSFASGLTSLVGYNPYVSIANSGITFAGNRVASLTVRQIRWYTESGDVYTVSAPIDIDTDLDPWN